MNWFTQAAANADKLAKERLLERELYRQRMAQQTASESGLRQGLNDSWSAEKRAEMRALLQAANTPVSDSDIASRMQQELDANAFPLDTPDGQVINPQLAALIASGMGLPEQAQPSSDPLAGIPIGIEEAPPVGPAPQYPQNGNMLRDIATSPALTEHGFGPRKLREFFVNLNDAMVSSTGQQPATAQAAPVQAQNLQGAAPEDIASLLGAMPQEAAPLQNDVSSIAAALSSDPAAAPEEKGFWGKLRDTLADPYIQEVMMQTGSGLSQSQPFGQALATGMEKGRARQAAIDGAPAAQRGQELAFRKLESEIAKNDAEALKLMKGLEASDSLSESDYSRVFTDMQKHVSSDIFRMAEDSPFKLDNETYARYLTNSGLSPESRRYGPLKAEYGDLMSTIWNDVATGKVKQSELESRIDEFEIAFGPQQTAQLLLQLQGK